MKNNLRRATALLLILALVFALTSCFGSDKPIYAESIADVPEFSGKAYAVINNNEPFFTEDEITAESYESYSPLDGLGRCGAAIASVGRDLMPTEDREGSLSSVTPTGWINVKYDIVSGEYLYNRAHLIGWQLTAETDNKYNLITGTRFMNVNGMLPFENTVADYVKETDNHVMYRVTPIFEGTELVARGVLMEAYSVEDSGEGVSFCVYVYNNQPGIRINYATGESKLDDGVPFPDAPSVSVPDGSGEYKYVLNTSSKKIHLPSCRYVSDMKEENKELTNESIEELEEKYYTRCGSCLGN